MTNMARRKSRSNWDAVGKLTFATLVSGTLWYGGYIGGWAALIMWMVAYWAISNN